MDATLGAHVAAGSLGIISGFVALYSAKGSPLHRKIGVFFVSAMLVMCFLGVLIAIARNAAPEMNGPAGLITLYLVVTGFTTVRPPFRGSRPLAIGMMVLGLAVALTALTWGFEAVANGGKTPREGMPAFPFFMFGTIGLLAAVSDVRVIRRGNPTGAARLVRHLWRMGYALFVAALSFFIGQADEFPEALRIIPLLALPGLAVLVTMGYWVWRLKVRRSLKGVVLGPVRPMTGAVPPVVTEA
jgi:hypothetical protein